MNTRANFPGVALPFDELHALAARIAAVTSRIHLPRLALLTLAVVDAVVPVCLTVAAGHPWLALLLLAVVAGLFPFAFRAVHADRVAGLQIAYWAVPLAGTIIGAFTMQGSWEVWTGISLVTFLLGMLIALLGTTWFDYTGRCTPYRNDFSFTRPE